MKPQHQVNFKRKRGGCPHPDRAPSKLARISPSSDVTRTVMLVGERELNFARALSDTEKSVRDGALHSLRAWLADNADVLAAPDLDRLWKALFYCIWMADKRPVITSTIAAVVGLHDLLGWPFLSALFRCLAREWGGIDRHRVDKFYELINAALAVAVCNVLQAEGNKPFVAAVTIFLNILNTDVWKLVGRGGLGLALHVLDIYVDRVMHPILRRGRDLPGNEVHSVFDMLLDDLYKMAGYSEGRLVSVGRRIHQRILSRLTILVADEEVNLRDKDQKDMVKRASKRIFVIASSKSTSHETRKGLYELRVKIKAFVIASESEELSGKPKIVCNKTKDVAADKVAVKAVVSEDK